MMKCVGLQLFPGHTVGLHLGAYSEYEGNFSYRLKGEPGES